MKIKELREKTEQELDAILSSAHKSLRELRSKVALKQIKNVREIREKRKTIAKVLTLRKSQ